MSDWKKKTVGVVGLGVTGYAVAEYLASQGARVLAYDKRALDDFSPEERTKWSQLPELELRTGHEKANALDGVELLIISPGVPDTIAPVARQREKGVPIWSEIELASREIHGPITAVGGTNGKSTVTEATGSMFKYGGWETFVGGNLGKPLIESLKEPEGYEQYVVEVSSYQMENIEMFRPHVAILLNVSPDHLDRYPSLNAYAAAKAKMFQRMLADDIAIINADDPIVRAVTPHTPQIWKWSTKEPVSLGAWADEAGLHFSTPPAVFSVPRDEIRLKGSHNDENLMAAGLAALTAGLTAGMIKDVIREFRGLPHRLQFVKEIRGVHYYDDSKGTNIGAVAAALKGFRNPVVLIAGGVDKGADYAEINDVIKAHVKTVIVIGEAADKISKAWGEVTKVRKAKDMAEAVVKASAAAARGDAVVLSPACSSFDMFKNYADRGIAFQRLVEELPS